MNNLVAELLRQRVFLTNPGTETFLLFQQGFELPEFCAFIVHEDEDAFGELEQNFLIPLYQSACNSNCGLILDSLVWRAHSDYIEHLGRSSDELAAINERAVVQTRASIDHWRSAHGQTQESFPVLISADIGPRGDGYKVADSDVSSEDSRSYHQVQIDSLAAAKVDLACALTMTSVAESIGIVGAATNCDLPIIVSPTVETNGRLPDGTPLGQFIEEVDDATNGDVLFYMVNCAHPNHLRKTLEAARSEGARWLSRFRGFRANASTRSHEELDNSTELDRGDVQQLARQMAEMQAEFGLRVVGGCCGTDHEHLAAIASKVNSR